MALACAYLCSTVCKAPFTRYNLFSNRFDNRLYRVYKHSTGLSNPFDNRLYNRCIVYTAGCQSASTTRFDNRLFSVSFRLFSVVFVSFRYLPQAQLTDTGRGYFEECGLRNPESCQGVICEKSSAEYSANYPLSLFRIPQPKNSAFLRIAKLPFARIAPVVNTEN